MVYCVCEGVGGLILWRLEIPYFFFFFFFFLQNFGSGNLCTSRITHIIGICIDTSIHLLQCGSCVKL